MTDWIEALDDAAREALEAAARDCATDFVRCATLYFYNTDPLVQIEAVRGKPSEPGDPYVKEKIGDYNRGLVFWFSRLDRERQRRWVAAAVDEYGLEVAGATSRAAKN